MQMLKVDVLRNDYLSTYVNSFVIQTTDHIVCIDTGLNGGTKQLTPYLDEDKKVVVLSTHGHWDHIGLHAYVQKRGGTIYAHSGDKRFMNDFEWHWNVLFGQFKEDFELPQARWQTFDSQIGNEVNIDCEIVEGQMIEIDDLLFKVIHTPGHSAGSVCFLEMSTGTMFTGDTLMGDGFFEGIPLYSDYNAYIKSMEYLLDMQSYVVYCDHNPVARGEFFNEKVQRGIACAKRIDSAVNEFVCANQSKEKIHLGDVVSHVCKTESKSVGAGGCVTVLAHLSLLSDKNAAIDACVKQYTYSKPREN